MCHLFHVCPIFEKLNFGSNKKWILNTPPKTNMTVEKQPFQDVFPIENVDFPVRIVSLQEGNTNMFIRISSSYQYHLFFYTNF